MKKKMCFIILCLPGILFFLNTPLKASIFYVTTTDDHVDRAFHILKGSVSISGVTIRGVCTYQQEFTITNSGSGILNRTIHEDRNWLNCTPTPGTNSAVIMVSVPISSDRRPGTYTGTITIESPDADNSPRTVTVNLAVSRGSIGQPSFGAIDTPLQGGTASGSDFVNFGWVLTPLPNTIPKDGSTINVWVDGVCGMR
jgi:hypothetical protein